MLSSLPILTPLVQTSVRLGESVVVGVRAIPVDVSVFGGFMCVNPPEVKANPRTGEVRTDTASGLPVFVVGVVAIRGRDSSVIQVSVPGEPVGLSVGTALRLVELEGVPWDVEGRSGVSFRASAVLPFESGPASTPETGRRPSAGSGPARGGDAS
jgi:hypothetical protein